MKNLSFFKKFGLLVFLERRQRLGFSYRFNESGRLQLNGALSLSRSQTFNFNVNEKNEGMPFPGMEKGRKIGTFIIWIYPFLKFDSKDSPFLQECTYPRHQNLSNFYGRIFNLAK
jgi:hypothetical protein